jgi:hypothetical protein
MRFWQSSTPLYTHSPNKGLTGIGDSYLQINSKIINRPQVTGTYFESSK